MLNKTIGGSTYPNKNV